MVNWFGPQSWGATICGDDGCPRCDIPVGDICGRCKQPFTEGDSGVTMPLLSLEGQSVIAYHLDCHLKSVLPHTHWPAQGLVPNEADGLVDGKFACTVCKMSYSTAGGWVRRLW